VKSFGEFASVPALLQHRADEAPDQPAVSFAGRGVTYAQLNDRAGSVQAWLARRGVGPGDKVALLMKNSLEFLYTWLGIARAGAIGVPLNTASIGDALRYPLEHSDAVGIVGDSGLLPALDATSPVPALQWQVSVGPADHRIPFAELLALPPVLPAVQRAGRDPMNIIYTSGTTGMPKGVVLSHASYTNTGSYFAAHLGYTRDDVLHTCLPLFHCNAQQTTFLAGLSVGAPVAISGKFSVSNFWSWIRESKATSTNLLGAMLALLAKIPESADDADNTLRYMLCAPVPEALHRPLEHRFGVRIVEGYGLTETGTMACINPVDDTRSGTIGLPLRHNKLRVVDEHDHDVPVGVPGQLITRSLILNAYMSGYYKEPQKTAEAMAGGWFHTGDRVVRRPDGYFVFLDRMKDAIRRRGENISSFLVEKIIGEHPALQEVVAVGVLDDLSEEEVKVFCVRQPGAVLTAAELSDWCAARLSDFMRPRYIEFRSDLPRTETGRVQKFQLRAEGVGAAWDRLASVK
jgi:crotonobetaine/carnitine-CoA ligase